MSRLHRPLLRVGLVAGVLAVGSVGYVLGQGSRKVVVAQEIRLTDRAGKTRALVAISPVDDTPVIKMLDAQGKARLGVSLDTSGGVHLFGWPTPPVIAPTTTALPGASPDPGPTARVVLPLVSGQQEIIRAKIPEALKFTIVKLITPSASDRTFGFASCKILCQIRATRPMGRILIQANFFDKEGKFLSEDTAFMPSLTVGEVWKFELECNENTAWYGKIDTIQTFE